MSSQASAAGRGEAIVRQKLIETGHVDVMISIRSNFFYTRAVPCELWFFNKAKPQESRDRVLMIDARNIYHKVTRKIFDFSPEQLQNILSIVWLYRGENKRFHNLVTGYISDTLKETKQCLNPLNEYSEVFSKLRKSLEPFLAELPKEGEHKETLKELEEVNKAFLTGIKEFEKTAGQKTSWWSGQKPKEANLPKAVEQLAPLNIKSHDLIKQAELIYRLANRTIDLCLDTHKAKENGNWNNKEINGLKKQAEEARDNAVDQLKRVRYFYHQAEWLTERFPEETLRDVEGLVKLVDRKELEENDWSLTPGRYVGVAPEEEDPDFDFEETMRNIHEELVGLDKEAGGLAKKISENFKELGL